MSLQIDESFLNFDYDEDARSYDAMRYFDEEATEPFNSHSSKQMLMMMNRISHELQLDEYAMKRLEVTLRTDLPFFAINRRLILNWINENFLF